MTQTSASFRSDSKASPGGVVSEVQLDQVSRSWKTVLDLTQADAKDSLEVYPFLLTVVIPVFNERDTVAQVVTKVAAIPVSCQIIIVDDGSTDGTREILQSIDDVELLLHETNRGKGAALRAGFAKAQGRFLVIQDADLEYDPCDIAALLEPLLRDEADVVYGSRLLRRSEHDQKWLHQLHQQANRCLTFGSNLFTGLKLTDMETCYKAMRIETLKGIDICQNRFGVEPELTAKLARRGARFLEVPISYDGRSFSAGKKVGVRDLFNAIWCIARYGLGD